MKKQLLSFVTLLCVVWLTPTRAAAYDFWVDGIYYNITSSSNPLTVEVTHNYNYNIVYAGAITIPERVTYNNVTYRVTNIGDYAFRECTGLTSVEIPASVTSIGREAFFNCRGLTSIVIPASVTSIGKYAFEFCSGLTSIAIPGSVTSIGESAFNGCSSLTSIEIPASVTSIGNWVFANCTGLTLIEIPASVVSIGEYAFQSCSGLTSVEIPASVTSIGQEAFAGCSGLTSIVVAAGNPKYDSRENCNALIETSSNTLLIGCKTTVIPASVTSIGEGAFAGCTGLTSIEIPASVTSIEDGAFGGCSGLTSIEIPASVTSIEAYAFYGCLGLTSIEIPASVTFIGGYAFKNCLGLTKIITRAIVPPTCSNYTWSNVNKSITLYVPAGTKAAYATAEGWKDFIKIKEFDATEITTLDAEASDMNFSDSEIYTMGGQRVDELQAGMNIVRMKNGKVKKIIKR